MLEILSTHPLEEVTRTENRSCDKDCDRATPCPSLHDFPSQGEKAGRRGRPARTQRVAHPAQALLRPITT